MTALMTTRRDALTGAAAAAAGLSLGFHLPAAEAQGLSGTPPLTPEINAWVAVRPDGGIVVRVARVEMGQGSLTGLAQLVAEELECDWSRVTTEYPSPGANIARGRVWGDYLTAGSRSIRNSHEYVRKGGAAARILLVRAAARRWGVAEGECVARDSVITHQPTGRTLTYGQVAAEAGRLDPPADAEIKLKDPKDWRLVGKPIKRLDTLAKVDGSQIYGIDFVLPGMLNAAIVTTPVLGGKVRGFDATKASAMRGVVKVVPVADYGVAVVADTWWRAKTALEAVTIDWDLGPNATHDSARMRAMMEDGLAAEQAFVGHRAGDVAAALAGAAKVVEAVYDYPHQHHVTMEPMNATALWTPERCDVWAPTQNAETALTTAVAASGLRLEQCDVHRINLGGGFGRRSSSHDFVAQAVLIAKQLPGVPVKLIWTREEDMLHGRYHPASMCKLTGGLDAAGNLVALKMRIAGQSILATINPNALRNGLDPVVFQGLNPADNREGALGYAIPNLLIDHAMRNPPVPPGFWRGVNNNQNAIYLECFIDELAHAAGVDPLAFRRRMMAPFPKHLAVLNAVAEKAGWGTPTPPGVHRGLCQHMGYGSYVAACAEVSVSDAGALTIHRIVAATDCGHAVNTQQIEAQIEGSFAYGLSALLYGEITFKNGRAEQENLDTYTILKMDEMPRVESVIAPSGDFWGGVGEPTIFVAAPAVLNAIFAATGKRIRSVPLSKADLRRA